MQSVPLGATFPRERVAELILKFKKRKFDADIARYSIEPHHGRMMWDGPIYYETNRGLRFSYYTGAEPLTIAYAGFDVLSSSLQICQLQGRKGAHELLRPFVWEQLLVRAIVELAKETGGCEEVRIRNAASLPFYATPHHLTLARTEHEAMLVRRYDETARRLGFTWNDRKGAFVRDIRTGS